MLELLRTNNDNRDFQNLITELNKELIFENINVNNEIQEKYNKLNVMENVNTVVIAYLDKIAIGCGCFRIYNNTSVEIKRMFVISEMRKTGIASLILKELEKWIKELEYKEILLETGKNMIGPLKLYKKNKYEIIDNYGPYIGINNSICMKKTL